MSYFNNFEPYDNFEPYRQFPPGPPPFGFPGGGGMWPDDNQNQGVPMGPPPSFTPSKPDTKSGINVKAVDPGSIRFCRFKFTYIWLNNGTSFWAYITFVGNRSISGFRWVRRRWVYFGVDLRQIDSFICY